MGTHCLPKAKYPYDIYKFQTLYHIRSTCDALYYDRQEVVINDKPTPDREWSIKRLEKFFNLPKVHILMRYSTKYDYKVIIYQENRNTPLLVVTQSIDC